MIVDVKWCIETMQEAHLAAIAKGFWDSKDVSIKEKFMLIICELAEAVEADRVKKRANLFNYHKDEREDPAKAFQDHIKGTLDEEIADAMIRAFDLCGRLDIDLMKIRPYELNPLFEEEKNFAAQIYYLAGILSFLNSQTKPDTILTRFIYFTWWACVNRWKVDIKKIVFIKMQYNKTRPKKHGKEY